MGSARRVFSLLASMGNLPFPLVWRTLPPLCVSHLHVLQPWAPLEEDCIVD